MAGQSGVSGVVLAQCHLCWYELTQRTLCMSPSVFLLQRLRDIPIIGWFTPDPPALGYDTTYEAQIHELNVWEAPEVSLRVAV